MAGQFEAGGINQTWVMKFSSACCKAMCHSGSMPERIGDKVEGSVNSLLFSVWKAAPAIE